MATLEGAALREEMAQLRLLVGEQAAELKRAREDADELRRQCFAWAAYHQSVGGEASEQPAAAANPLEAADAPPLLPVDPNSGRYTPTLGEGCLDSPAPRVHSRPAFVSALDLSHADLGPSDEEEEGEGEEDYYDEGEGYRAGAEGEGGEGDDSDSSSDGGDVPPRQSEGSLSRAHSRPGIPTLNISWATGGQASRADFDAEFAQTMADAPAAADARALGFDTLYERAIAEGPSADASSQRQSANEATIAHESDDVA
ncbi:hypothetical protein T492DRAFT_1010018 [Pavlovales sp. CCMP2436]|nr:hypothetical protein T492DRAFT_1010018 [Pavlovales sp. CCMP2436]